MGGSVVDFLKGINMKVVAEMAAEAWSEIKQDTLRKLWQKIIPVSPLPTVSRGCAIWRGVRIRIRSDSEETEPDKAEQRVWEEIDELEISTFQDMLKEIGFDTDSDTIAEWLSNSMMKFVNLYLSPVKMRYNPMTMILKRKTNVPECPIAKQFICLNNV